MNFVDYLIVFSALIVLMSAIRYTYLQWKNHESQETVTLRTMLIRYAGERDRLLADRDHWMREAANRFVEIEELRKKLAHFRKQFSPSELAKIDESWHGEKQT